VLKVNGGLKNMGGLKKKSVRLQRIMLAHAAEQTEEVPQLYLN